MIEFILFIAGCVVGWHLRESFARWQLAQLTQQIQDGLPKIKSIPIKISKIGDMIYVHNESTGQFMAQGTTHEEISEKIVKMFPNTVFLASEVDAKDTGYPDERI